MKLYSMETVSLILNIQECGRMESQDQETEVLRVRSQNEQ